jgi:hypothetical protein
VPIKVGGEVKQDTQWGKVGGKVSPKKKASSAATAHGNIRWLPVEQLGFDSANPRLAELGLSGSLSDVEMGKVLWRELAADEIVMSIVAAGGFFKHEPLFVEKSSPRKYTVIEGNRRLAAVRLLRETGFRQRVGAQHEVFDEADPDLIAGLDELPVIVAKRHEIWQYVGFKHVNGPRPWGALSKAKYIARIHEVGDVPLDEIAKQIGDRHATVKRLYRGLVVLRQARENGVFDPEDRWTNRFAFSHLYTGLDYDGFQRFLGIREETSYRPNPVPKRRLHNLGELCVWLYGSKSNDERPLIHSQNPDLKRLDTALETDSGTDALRAGLPLETARDASLGDKRLFRDALSRAKNALQEGYGKCVTGYDGSKDLLDVAEAIHDVAVSLVDQMENMRRQDRRRGAKGTRKR